MLSDVQRIIETLSVPAAEYVPTIADALVLLEELADRAARQEAVPAGYWLAPMEPDEAMWSDGRDPIHYRDTGEYRPKGVDVPAWQREPDGTVNHDKSKGTAAVRVWRAMRDSWLSRHAAPLAQQAAPAVAASEPVAYLYHDGPSIEAVKAHPMMYSVCLSLERQSHMRNETPLMLAAPQQQAQAVGAWRDIATAPKEAGSFVLLGTVAWVCEGWWDDSTDSWWERNNHDTDAWGAQIYPTHWQPLPEPPGSQGAAVAAVESETAKDAARYRWLREQITHGPLTIAASSGYTLQPKCGDDPDRFIDAARSAQETGKGGAA